MTNLKIQIHNDVFLGISMIIRKIHNILILLHFKFTDMNFVSIIHSPVVLV